MRERATRAGASPRFSRRAVVGVWAALLLASLLALAALFRARPPRPALGQVETSPATLTVARAEVRREPASGAEAVEPLTRGARLEVRHDLGLWIEVRTADGATGYLPAETLERDSDRETRERRARTILSFPPVPGLVAEEADILLAPFPIAPRAGRLSRGTTIRIHSVDHAYYAFRAADGSLAFVESGKVDLIPPDPRRPAILASRDTRPLKDLSVTDLPSPVPEGAPGEAAGPAEPIPSPAESTPAPAAPPTLPAPLEPAALLSKVEPSYPEAARRFGAQGTVVLEATIGADGRVTRVDVLRGLPYGLTEAAVEAVRRWQYRPARGLSGPVASQKEVRILFTLRP